MGRTATREEKRVKGRAQYASSEQCVLDSMQRLYSDNLLILSSAKAIRSAQNQRAYQRRIAHKSTVKANWPRIPAKLKNLGMVPIPRGAHFFIQEARTQDVPRSDDPLGIWDDFPPYASTYEPLGKASIEALIERLHGRQYRYQKHQEITRISRFRSAECINDTFQEIAQDINSLFAEWKILRALLKTFPEESLDHTVGHLHMQWKSRRVLDLLEDWKALKKDGIDGFMTVYCNRW